VTGAFGLVGSDLVPDLQKKYGKGYIFALANRTVPQHFSGTFAHGDVRSNDVLGE